jgi:hypothetical protein
MYSSLREREFSYNNYSNYPPTYPLTYYTSTSDSRGSYSYALFSDSLS